jgi:hypothetical protein
VTKLIKLSLPLHIAVKEYKYRDKIPQLIENGADTSATDDDGNTALHLACTERCESHILESLINGRVNVDALNRFGKTALDITCDKNHYELLPVLIKGGANVNRIVDASGNTVLHKVFMNLTETITPMQNILIRHGADLYAINNFGKSPLDIAVDANNWQKTEWGLNNGSSLNWLCESQLRLAATGSNAETPVLNRAVTYQLKVFGKYCAYKIAKDCPKMPAELIRKQLHFLWGGQGKYFDDIIDNVMTAFEKNYKATSPRGRYQ